MRILNRLRLTNLWQKIKGDQKGAALIVSLLVLMVLVLLALSLVLQSQTEYLGAVNENDSLTALSYAESGLEWAERTIRDKATGTPDLDIVLIGPDGVPGNTDDNLPGIRPLSPTLTLTDLNSTCPGANCEKNWSVKFTFDWDGDNTPEFYEALRTGTDLDGDGNWDGPRAIVYLRVEDNYDDPANSGVQDQDDNDWRARVRVMVDYPIFVNDAGVAQDPVLATRGTARRRLEGRLSPVKTAGIRTNKEFLGEGTPKLCGACGGIHSNGNMQWRGGAAEVCADATASGNYSDTGPGPNVGGEKGGGKPEQPIPTINPYDPIFVPQPATFDHSGDGELNLGEPVGTALRCSPTATDPGASKYFALVFKKQNGQNLQIYKAYWDFAGASGTSRWLWRLIDEGPTLNAVLDNCGRLVASPDLGLGPDPCPAGNVGCDGSGVATYGVSDVTDCCGAAWEVADGGDGNTYCQPNCMDPGPDGIPGTPDDINRCVPDGTISACDDLTSGDAQFYGFRGGNNYVTDTCSTDDSLSGLTENDYNQNAFFLFGGGTNSDTGVPALPGTLGPSDGIADFDYSVVTQPNRQKWDNDTTTIFSPLYNAVIFGFGNMDFNGNMAGGKIQFYDHDPVAPNVAGTYTTAIPNGRWRVSIISYGRVQVRGAPRFAPANGGAGICVGSHTGDGCHVGFVAGRDLDLAGGGGSGCDADEASCQLCPPANDPNVNCEEPLSGVPLGFEGFFVAHEQVNLSGNTNFVGFVMAEEAAYCVETQPNALQTRMNGTPDIYYDCEHPPDPWMGDRLRIQSWEEIQ